MRRRAGAVVLRREETGGSCASRCVVADTTLRGCAGCSAARACPGRRHRRCARRGRSTPPSCASRSTSCSSTRTRSCSGSLPESQALARAFCRGARDVVELAAGECARYSLEPGDQVTWAARPESRPESDPQATSKTGARRTAGRPVCSLGTGDDQLPAARTVPPDAQSLRGSVDEARGPCRRPRRTARAGRRRDRRVRLACRRGEDRSRRSRPCIQSRCARGRRDGEPPRWTTGLKVTEKWAALETLPEDIRVLTDDAGVELSTEEPAAAPTRLAAALGFVRALPRTWQIAVGISSLALVARASSASASAVGPSLVASSQAFSCSSPRSTSTAG